MFMSPTSAGVLTPVVSTQPPITMCGFVFLRQIYLGAHCEWTNCTYYLCRLILCNRLFKQLIKPVVPSSLSLTAYTTLNAIFVLFSVRLFTKCTSTKRNWKFLQFWYLVCLLILHALLVVVSVIILILYVYVEIVVCLCIYIQISCDPVVDLVLYLAQLYNLLWYQIIPGWVWGC